MKICNILQWFWSKLWTRMDKQGHQMLLIVLLTNFQPEFGPIFSTFLVRGRCMSCYSPQLAFQNYYNRLYNFHKVYENTMPRGHWKGILFQKYDGCNFHQKSDKWKSHPWMEKPHPWMKVPSLDVIHGWRNVIHGWHPRMKTTDDGHERSKNYVTTWPLLWAFSPFCSL